MGNYRLGEEAEADLIRIHQWGFRRFGEEQADRYYMAFFDHFEKLAKQPFLYPVSEIRGDYRRSVCGKDHVFYRIDGDTVEIMAIIGRQDVDQWFKNTRTVSNGNYEKIRGNVSGMQLQPAK